jgi:hypothetical protein
MVDCLPGGPVAGKPMVVQDIGAYGGSGDRPILYPLWYHRDAHARSLYKPAWRSPRGISTRDLDIRPIA